MIWSSPFKNYLLDQNLYSTHALIGTICWEKAYQLGSFFFKNLTKKSQNVSISGVSIREISTAQKRRLLEKCYKILFSNSRIKKLVITETLS